MELIKNKIIAEIGNNHLGDFSYFKEYVDKIIKLKIKYTTIQIREKEFYSSDNRKLILNSTYIHDQFNRLKESEINVGLAVADTHFGKFTNNYIVDFYKILSWKAEDYELIDFLLTFEKPIYISLGTLPGDRIIKLSERLGVHKNIKFIYTQLNYNVDDLNLNFLKSLKSKIEIPISYGHHAKNSIFPIILSLSMEIDKIFIYLKLNDSNIFPDNEHAFNINKLNVLLDNLELCLRFLGKDEKNESYNMIERLANERKI